MNARMQQLHTLVTGYRRINTLIGNLEADMQQNAMEAAFLAASKRSIKDCFGTEKRIKQQRQEMSLLLDAARKQALRK